MHEEDIGPNGGSLADQCLSPQNRGIRVNNDMITDIGMALTSLDHPTVIILLKAAGSKRHRMVELHMMTNPARFPDNHASSVIDKEVSSNRGPGMDVDSGALVDPLSHHAREQLNAGNV